MKTPPLILLAALLMGCVTSCETDAQYQARWNKLNAVEAQLNDCLGVLPKDE